MQLSDAYRILSELSDATLCLLMGTKWQNTKYCSNQALLSKGSSLPCKLFGHCRKSDPTSKRLVIGCTVDTYMLKGQREANCIIRFLFRKYT